MSSQREVKSLVFKENTYKLLKIHSIGYNDFSQNEISEFFCSNIWHALYYVESGTGNFTIRNKKYNLKAGSLFFITPNEAVRYISDKNDPIKYFWIALYPNFAEEICEILGFTEEEPTHMARVPQKVEWVFSELLESKAVTPDVYFASLSSLMQILSTEASAIDVPDSTMHNKAFVKNVKQLIKLNYANPEFNINTIAQMLYISHSQMTRIFKEFTGITPVSYLIEVRLMHAAELLKKESYTVKELCELVGFGDEWHFMKTFKKKFGMTIKEYQNLFTRE